MADKKVSFLLTAKDRTADAFNSVNSRLEKLDKLAVGVAAGGIAATAAGLAVLTRNAFATNDSLGKIADTIGISTEKLAGLRQAAELTGVGAESLDKALQKLQRSVGDAIRGTSTQVDAIERLGLSVEQLAQASPDEQFNLISDGLQNVTTRAEQAAVAAALFGREGINMLNTLELGSDELERITAEVEDFGVALDRVEVAQIEAANDAFTRAQAAAQGVGNSIAVQVAPFVEEIANRFADAAAETDGFGESLATAGEIGVTVLGFLADRFQDVYRGVLVVQGAIAQAEATFRGFFGLGSDAEINEALAAVDAAFAKLDESIEAGRVSERLKAEVEEIRVASRERAEAIAAEVEARNAARTGSDIEVGESLQEKKAREREAQREKDAQQRAEEAARKALERLEGDLLTEEERLAESYRRRREIIEENLRGPEDEERRQELLLRVEQDYAQQRAELAGINLTSELEAERERYEARKALAEELLEDEKASAEQRNEILEDLEKEHQERMAQIEEKGLTDRDRFERKTTQEKVKFVTDQLVALTQGTAQSSKTMFRINKIAAIANATINTAEGVTKTLAAYPYPLNVALAALSAAAGVAQINAIRSTSFDGGGGGTTPSAAGSTPVINDQPVETDAGAQQGGGQVGRTVTQVVINGNFYGNEEAISDLIDAIEERINEGDQIFIDPTSRQADVIRTGT